MKSSRKVRLWLADRYPQLDTPDLYRSDPPRPGKPDGLLSGLLLGFTGLMLVAFGLAVTVIAGLILWAIVATVFGW